MNDKAKQIIARAEERLGPLSEGQRVDLLMDQMPELQSVSAARELVTGCRPAAWCPSPATTTLPGSSLDDDRLTINDKGEIVPVEPLDDEAAGELLDEETPSPVCARCREQFTPHSRIVTAKDGARYHSRCWSNDR